MKRDFQTDRLHAIKVIIGEARVCSDKNIKKKIEQDAWEPNHKVDTSLYRMFRIMSLKLQDIIIWDMLSHRC